MTLYFRSTLYVQWCFFFERLFLYNFLNPFVGYGNPNSSSIVNRYQYEITKLKEMVVETLREYHM